jgi:hypothetical protein
MVAKVLGGRVDGGLCWVGAADVCLGMREEVDFCFASFPAMQKSIACLPILLDTVSQCTVMPRNVFLQMPILVEVRSCLFVLLFLIF